MIIDLDEIKKKNDLVENIDFYKTFSTKEKRLIQLEPSYYFKDFSKFIGLKNFTLKTLKEKINEEDDEKLKFNKIEKQKKLKELEEKLKIRKKRRRKDVSDFDVVLINTFINDDVDSNEKGKYPKYYLILSLCMLLNPFHVKYQMYASVLTRNDMKNYEVL